LLPIILFYAPNIFRGRLYVKKIKFLTIIVVSFI